MRRSLLLLSLVCLAAYGHAQTIAQYLEIRKTSGISQPSDVTALDTIVGDRVVEISAVVKGSFKVGDHGSLMIDKPGGGTDVIDCPSIPDWLVGNATKARMLVKVSRKDESSEPDLELLGAAPENLVAPHDRASHPAPTARTRYSRRSSGSVLMSRSAGRFTRTTAKTVPVDQAIPIYAECIKGYNPRLSDQEAMNIADGVIHRSLEYTGNYKVDARLIMAIITVESHFNPYATSSKGAQGLGQLMPGTAAGLGVDNSYDTQQNLYGMVRLVASNLAKYRQETGGDEDAALQLAVAAYNAGNGAVAKYHGIPPYAETQNYVRKVITTYMQFCGEA